MAGSQHSFPSNFVSATQNDMRSQFTQRGQLPGISSPSQQSVGISSPQPYNIGVNMQPPADSPIPPPQLQQTGPPTPQQLQLQIQQRQQQQASQQQDSQQSNQSTNIGPAHNPQQVVSQPPQSSVPQQPSLQSHQPVSVTPGNQNVNAPLHSVSQSVVSSTGITSNVAGAVPQQQPCPNPYDTASLCFMGQDTVQDIVTKVQDIFGNLKTLLPPTGTAVSASVSSEKRAKLHEYLRTIKNMFKRLRLIYEKCNDNSQLQGMEYMHIESLIPLKEEWDMKTSEERKTSEAYRLASEECKKLIDQVIMKNNQLKEIIDHLRRIVWEINTMLTMRKS